MIVISFLTHLPNVKKGSRFFYWRSLKRVVVLCRYLFGEEEVLESSRDAEVGVIALKPLILFLWVFWLYKLLLGTGWNPFYGIWHAWIFENQNLTTTIDLWHLGMNWKRIVTSPWLSSRCGLIRKDRCLPWGCSRVCVGSWGTRIAGTEKFEPRRTRTNSNTSKNRGNDRQNAMNYGEWSKSIELEQTLTRCFSAAGLSQSGREDFWTEGREGREVKKIAWDLRSVICAGSGGRSHNKTTRFLIRLRTSRILARRV